MSIATEIARIQGATATIRSKYVELGIGTSTDKIDDLATASEQIENKGAITATVSEGSTYTIPKGYHNGSGTVTGIAPAADAEVSSWEIPDMIGPNNPSPYSVTSSDDSEDAYKVFDGNTTTGWSAENTGDKWITFDFGQSTKVDGVRLTPSNNTNDFPGSFTVLGSNDGETWVPITEDPVSTTTPQAGSPQSYDLTPSTYKSFRVLTTGSAFDVSEIEFRTVSLVSQYSLQAKVITPTTQQQNATPDEGFYGLSSVTINPIPENYKDVSVVSADAEDVLSGKTIVDALGKTVAGTMPNNGAISQTIDGLSITSVVIPAGYTSGGTVELDDTIENALAEI